MPFCVCACVHLSYWLLISQFSLFTFECYIALHSSLFYFSLLTTYLWVFTTLFSLQTSYSFILLTPHWLTLFTFKCSLLLTSLSPYSSLTTTHYSFFMFSLLTSPHIHSLVFTVHSLHFPSHSSPITSHFPLLIPRLSLPLIDFHHSIFTASLLLTYHCSVLTDHCTAIAAHFILLTSFIGVASFFRTHSSW